MSDIKPSEQKTYLLTGCAGFIGWKVGEFLLKKGERVIGVDNLNDAYDPRLKKWRLNELKKLNKLTQPNFIFYNVDICDYSALKSIFSLHLPFHAIINLAARTGVRDSLKNPWIYMDTNIRGLLNLLELMKEFEIKKLVQASSSSIYGNSQPPFKEDQKNLHPLSPYAASKEGAEALSYSYHHLYGIDITILRYFTVYGPAGRPDLSIFKFIKHIAEGIPIPLYGDGEQERDFTYVDDIAKGTLVGFVPLGFECINLGNNRPVKLNYVIKLIEDTLKKRAIINRYPPHPADIYTTHADINKAKTLLGWKPEVQIEEGIRRCVKWYLENQKWAKNISTDL